ncbi:MAG: DUF1214 domain-containing protein [Acidimicrobiia bacterium]|jgi:hypothetical protein
MAPGDDEVASATAGDETEVLDAWRDFCRRLEATGERVLGNDFPGAPEERVAAIEHLAGQALCWTGWSVFHADPRRPRFQRQNDPITPWGGPNADNVYRHARVDAARRYRVRGRMRSCEDFMLAVRMGFMHQPRWGTVFEVAAHDLGIGRGDEFELVVGGAEPEDADGRWIPLPEGAAMVSFREYYFDWDADEPATMTIECLDDDVDVPAPRRGAAELAVRLAEAASGVEHSVEYWNRYLDEHRSENVDNAFAPPMKVTKGLAAARYGFLFWDLDDDEVLLVESDVPAAAYWSFMVYDLGTYELVDPLDRPTSLNHTQAVVDPDGRVRVVLAPTDPGAPNWLDTGGRRCGQLTFRWFWSDGDPAPSARVVARDALFDALPAGTARVDPDARRAVQRARREHLAWRFRT